MSEPVVAPEEPVAPPFHLLSRMERVGFHALGWLGTSRIGRFWQTHALENLFSLFITRRLVVTGMEAVRALPPGTPIMLCANHSTFFDQFVLGWVLQRDPRTRRFPTFPVRGNFFYESPLGLLIGILMSGGTMWPPFFRPVSKKPFNRYSLQLLIQRMREPGNLVGFHPEGTRNKSGNVYELLPAQPGAGELALKARPAVIPAFISGLSNSITREVWSNLRRKNPIVIVFGGPIDLSDYPTSDTRLSHHKRCADAIVARIRELGEQEKQVRAAMPPLGRRG